MNKIILSLLLPAYVVIGSCGNRSEEETGQDVLEQFDENSPRPDEEDEFQEDSAIRTSEPAQKQVSPESN